MSAETCYRTKRCAHGFALEADGTAISRCDACLYDAHDEDGTFLVCCRCSRIIPTSWSKPANWHDRDGKPRKAVRCLVSCVNSERDRCEHMSKRGPLELEAYHRRRVQGTRKPRRRVSL